MIQRERLPLAILSENIKYFTGTDYGMWILAKMIKTDKELHVMTTNISFFYDKMSSTRAMHRHKIINIIMKLWIIFTLQKTSLKNFLLSNGHFIARPFIISEFFSFISTVFNVSVALPSGPLIQLKVQFVFLVWILHLFGLPVNLIKLVISVLLVNLFNLLKITCYTMLNYCNAAIFLLSSYFCYARWKIN